MAHDKEQRLRTFHLFAGAGGGILADLLLGHTPVGACEIEPYPRAVLLQRQRDGILPEFPIWDDVRTLDGRPWRGSVDVLCGGFPCTDISPARSNNHINGKIKGLAGESSGLWFEQLRIIEEIRPGLVYIENSRNLRTRGLVTILQGLEKLGYNAKWCVLESGFVGADHHRARMWILAYSNSAQLKRGSLSGRVHKENANSCGTNRGEDKPGLERVANGVARQMDRLKAIGNGQDPRVAKLAWEILTTEKHNEM